MSASPVTGLSHIAIATRDAAMLSASLTAALGCTVGHQEILDDGTLRVLFLHLGPVTLELLEPLSPDHTVAKFIDQRGPGLHHVSLEVQDVSQALDRARTAGVKLVDREPREGADGTLVAFLHPKSLGGVLIELCQSGKPTA
jgi:methylmalonyl-CoA epimerase